MSRPREFNWKEAGAIYCAGLLLALGMGLTFYQALLPQQAIWPAVALCAVFTLICQGLFALRFKWKWLIPLLLIALPVIWLLLGSGPLYPVIQGIKAAYLSFNGVPEAAAPYATDIRWAICLLFSLLGAALAWDRSLPLALFSVISVIALAYLISARAQVLLCALPAAAGLLTLLAAEEGKRPAALMVAVALAAGAFFLLPQTPHTLSPLPQAAQSVRQFVEDYLLFNEYRASFSLTTEGYQPLGERLGGPAQPTDELVMEVRTDRTMLLRGRTYDDYSGLNWYDTLSSRRYLFSSPRFTAQRDDLFDLNRPILGDVLPAQTAHIHMLGNSTTTLFAPARTRTLIPTAQRMVLYYNLAAERFITRELQPGDTYTLAYLPYAPGLPETTRAVLANQEADDPNYALVSQRYLGVPRHIQQEIYDIAARATQGAGNDYEKALGIQKYLRENYTYSLNVQSPPEGVDFAAWFLIGEKQGYCTYFATAMTVLCRIAGLPARYVTGYLAAPDDSGVAVVTGENAHAWTEVYLNGFGWLDFDATPRSNNRPGSDSGQTPPSPDADPTPSPTPESAPTPEIDITPTPEPSAVPPEQEENSPTPTPNPPEEGAEPTPSSSPQPPPEEPPRNNPPPFPWWAILLILLLIALLLLRYFFTEPLRRARRHPDKAVSILFAAVCGLLRYRRLRRAPQETLHEFAARADLALTPAGQPALSPLADAYAAQLYGNHPADSAPFFAAYRRLRDHTSRWTRLRLALKRIFTRR